MASLAGRMMSWRRGVPTVGGAALASLGCGAPGVAGAEAVHAAEASPQSGSEGARPEPPAPAAAVEADDIISEAWDFADPKASEARFLDLARSASERGDRALALELQTQAARAQGLDGRFEAGERTLAAVESDGAATADVLRVRILLERGRLLNSSDRAEEAKPMFEAAWKIAHGAGLEGSAVDAAHMVAIAVGADADLAIEWNDKALSVARGSSQPAARRWLGALGRAEVARGYSAQAYGVLSQDAHFSKHESSRLERIGTLGGVL